MTTDELVDRTQQLLGNRSSTVLSDAYYLDRVNEAYQWLSTFDDRIQGRKRSIRFNELEDQISRTLAASPTTNFVANSANVFSVIALWDTTNARAIERKGSRRLARQNPALEGRILMWSPAGSNESGTRVAGYRIWKKPDVSTAIIETVYLNAEALVAAGVGPVIPSIWHTPIYIKAAAITANLEGLPDEAAKFNAAAIQATRELRLPSDDAQSFGSRRFGVMERI